MEKEQVLLKSNTVKGEMTDFPERLLNMKKNYEKKIEEQQIKKFEEQFKSIKNPQICKKSEEIVQKLNRIDKVEDRLYLSLKETEEKLELKHLAESVSSKLQSVPKITQLAQNMKRSGTISDRLTRYKLYYAENLKNLNIKYHPEIPETKARSNSAARERLLKPKSRSLTPESEKFSFKPNLTPNSLKIAKKLEKSSSRLLKSPSPSPSFKEEECSFRPSINSLSAKLDNRKTVGSERWESLYQLKDLHQEKIKTLMEDSTAPDPECTFKPLIKISRENSSPASFVDRVNGWKKSINQKIVDKRDSALEDDLRKCTFSPEITAMKVKTQEQPLSSSRKKENAYSKKYQQISADDFLTAVQALHSKLHSDT